MKYNLNDGLTIVQEKKSGLLWILFAVCLVPLIVFFLFYGLFLSTKNTVIYITGRSERKLKRLERKQNKLMVKENIKEIKENINKNKGGL